ncbi:MAG: hypothetical protein AB7J35_01795 [Dehalococcoidia bacterium]
MNTAPFPFFGSPSERGASVHIFHDESGFTGDARFGHHGLLAVPDKLVEDFGGELRRLRRSYGYPHEVHFKDLGSTSPSTSPSWLLARSWLNLLFQFGLNEARLKVFGVDMKHVEFDRARYPKPLHAYRRFAVTVAKSMVAWCYRDLQSLSVTPYTDSGNPHANYLRSRDGTLFDSFERYLVSECQKERRNGKEFYPEELTFARSLTAIPSSPSKLTPELADSLGLTMRQLETRSDLIQLVDLVVGCVAAAVRLDLKNEGKKALVEQVAGVLSKTYSLPLWKALDESRRFSVSFFPGPGRTPYSVSLSGVRRYGLDMLQANAGLKQLHLSRVGFRPDSVPIISEVESV